MFNLQNLNGLFNLNPETINQINQAASVASVPKPAPVVSPVIGFNTPDFNFPGMLQPTTEPVFRPAPAPAPVAAPAPAPASVSAPAPVAPAPAPAPAPVAPAPIVTPPAPSGGMLTSAPAQTPVPASGLQGFSPESEEILETFAEAPSENQQFYVIPSNENEVDKRGYMQYSVESGVQTMDEAELKKYYESEDNKLLRESFPDFNTYRNYMAEKSALYDDGTLDKWWQVTEEQEKEFVDSMFDVPDSVTTAEEFGDFLGSQGVFGVTEDPSSGYITEAVTSLMSPEEKAAYEAQQVQDYKETGAYQNSRYSQYNAQAEQQVLQDLSEKYGAPSRTGESITDSDGSKYQWTGDGYIKVADPPEESLLGQAVELAVKGGITAALTAGLAPVLTSAGGLSAGAAKGAAAGLASAGVQGATTGKIDPKSVLASALTAGLGAGDAVNEALGGINPESFVGGAVNSVVNNAITQGIVTGSLDTDELLKAGLTGGAINSIKDFIKSANSRGLDQEVEKYMLQGNSREDAVRLALESGIVDTSSLGGLVGPDGLLAPLGLDEYVDTSWLGKTTDFLGLTGPTGEMFQDQDGNLFTENEVIAQGYDPSEIYYGTDTSSGLQPVNVTQDLTTIGKIANAPVAAFEKVFGGALDSAARSAFINKYGFDPNDPANSEAAKAVFASGGYLDERYTFTPEGFERTPDSTLYGVLQGIEDAYTTGPSFESQILPDPTPGSTGVGTTYVDIGGQFTPTTVDEVADKLTGGEKLYGAEVTLPTYEDDTLDVILQGIAEGVQAANKEDTAITDKVDSTEEVDIGKDDTTADLTADTTKEDLDVIEESVEEELDVIEEDIKEDIKEDLGVTEEDIEKEFDAVEEDIKEDLNVIKEDIEEEDLGVTEEEDLGVTEEEDLGVTEEEDLGVTEEEDLGVTEEEEEDLPAEDKGGAGFSGLGGGLGSGDGDFKPYMSGISYQLPQIAEIIQSPNVDYNAQLNAIINRNVGLFEGML